MRGRLQTPPRLEHCRGQAAARALGRAAARRLTVPRAVETPRRESPRQLAPGVIPQGTRNNTFPFLGVEAPGSGDCNLRIDSLCFLQSGLLLILRLLH